MAAATCSRPAARATSMPRWIEWIQAAQLKGTTTPVVPRIESPPTMPRRGLRVFWASASPPGMAMVTTTSTASPVAAAISATTSRIIWRGTGLIAASPGAICRPGRVTVPTPLPA